MSSGKGKRTTINHIDQLNLCIDYDKLAESIVKAQKSAKERETEHNLKEKKKMGFWKSIGRIILNRDPISREAAPILLSTVLWLLFNMLALLGVIGLFVVMAFTGHLITTLEWSFASFFSNVGMILPFAAILVIISAFSLVFRCAANDIKKENDRNYIVDLFSGVVGLVALIVSFIALYKSAG